MKKKIINTETTTVKTPALLENDVDVYSQWQWLTDFAEP